MNNGRSVWFGLVWFVIGCGVDSGARGPDAARDAGTDAGTDAGPDAARDAGTDAGTDASNDMIVNAPNNPFPCLNPVAAPSVGDGIFQCDNGMQVRPEVPDCPASGTPARDACRKDSDCDTGMACACGSSGGILASACLPLVASDDCRSSHECAPGFHCAYAVIGWSDWAIWHLRCQQPSDECVKSEDCLAIDQDAGVLTHLSGSPCQADSNGRYCCDPMTGVCPVRAP